MTTAMAPTSDGARTNRLVLTPDIAAGAGSSSQLSATVTCSLRSAPIQDLGGRRRRPTARSLRRIRGTQGRRLPLEPGC